MNNQILRTYKVEFDIVKSDSDKTILVSSSVIPQISGYLLKCYPDYLNDEVLPEVTKAINGLGYDSDGGGVYSALTIGAVNSTIENIYNPSDFSTIPTVDLKEILLAYVEWITQNNLEDYI